MPFTKNCSVSGCLFPYFAKGLCKKHYKAAAHKVYYAKNKEKITRYNAKWRAANLDKVRAADRARHARDPDLEFRRRRTLHQVFSKARSDAKKKGRVWEITLADLVNLRSSPCHYCQFPLPPTGSGLDRKDNSLGYLRSNVVPCCTDCNRTRGDRYSYPEMLEIGALLRKLKLQRALPSSLPTILSA